MPTVSAHCRDCGHQHDLTLLAGMLGLVSDGPRSVWCPSCDRVARLDIRRPVEVRA